MSTQTAKQTYKTKMKQIEKHMAEIKKQLANHIDTGDDIHWGHVGDLGHVEELMHQAEAFLKNEDIDD